MLGSNPLTNARKTPDGDTIQDWHDGTVLRKKFEAALAVTLKKARVSNLSNSTGRRGVAIKTGCPRCQGMD
jgi:hypothetical protein